jgi:hypothetical protein
MSTTLITSQEQLEWLCSCYHPYGSHYADFRIPGCYSCDLIGKTCKENYAQLAAPHHAATTPLPLTNQILDGDENAF